jgi:hypothetical protein
LSLAIPHCLPFSRFPPSRACLSLSSIACLSLVLLRHVPFSYSTPSRPHHLHVFCSSPLLACGLLSPSLVCILLVLITCLPLALPLRGACLALPHHVVAS